MPALVVSWRHSVKETDFLHTSADFFFKGFIFLDYSILFSPKPSLPSQKFSLFSWKEIQLPWRKQTADKCPMPQKLLDAQQVIPAGIVGGTYIKLAFLNPLIILLKSNSICNIADIGLRWTGFQISYSKPTKFNIDIIWLLTKKLNLTFWIQSLARPT